MSLDINYEQYNVNRDIILLEIKCNKKMKNELYFKSSNGDDVCYIIN